jgi:hypothetical protein
MKAKAIVGALKSFIDDRLLPALAWLWAHVMAVVRMLWICRAAVLPVLIGVALIGWTDQARDIVIADAVPARRNWLPMLIILVAVTVWSTVAWYWARITVQYTPINPQPAQYKEWHGQLTVEVPRLIGTAGMLSVALAYWQAHKLYSYAGDLVRADRFILFMWLYIAIAGVFYIAVRNRSVIAGWLTKLTGFKSLSPDREQTDKIFDRKHPAVATLLVLSVLASPVFFILVLRSPVGMNDQFFRGAVPAALLGFALMVPVGSWLVMAAAKTKFPWFGAAIAWVVASPILFGDFHDVRTLRTAKVADGSDLSCAQQDARWASAGEWGDAGDKRPSLKQAYLDWWKDNAEITAAVQDTIKAPPLVMVATAGGASRAAFWTSQVLGEIAAREPHFAERLFMISGVSGGSLGALTFRSLVEADRRATPDGKGSPLLPNAAKDARKIIEQDFLGPTFAAGLYVDLPANGLTILSRSWAPNDRGVAIEKAWEAAWAKSAAGSDGKLDWGQGFVATFGGSRPWPLLALNGTSVEKGKRIVTSNVKLGASGGVNHYDTFDIIKADIPASTAVTMSARFPVISPTGALRDCNGKAWTRVTDGGLFENFGALTLDEALRYLTLRAREVQSGDFQAVPLAILISSDPSLDRLHLREDGRPSSVPPDCAPAGRDGSPEPRPHPGNGWIECPANVSESAKLFGDPVKALYDGRVARGEAAATALADRVVDIEGPLRERLSKLGVPFHDQWQRLGLNDHNDFFHFRQCRVHRKKGPTMSWHDSDESWNTLREMLGIDEGSRDDCGNGAEFFRLCMRLSRLTSGMSDLDASNACAQRWPRPVNWLCVEYTNEWGSRWRCGLPVAMNEPRRAQLQAPGLR